MKGNVKTYIFIGFVMLLAAVALSAGVFFMVQQEFKKDSQDDTLVTGTQEDAVTSDTTAQPNSRDTAEAPQSVPANDIPLKDLPLSDGQREMAETFGIDVDTFVITPDMQYCAKLKLGEERFNAIVAGDAPTLTEGTSLLLCL